MKERPILFSAPMIRAILDGRKTQTRRTVAHEHIAEADIFSAAPVDLAGRREFGVAGEGGVFAHGDFIRCPYGVPGDRLWVRETHRLLEIPRFGEPGIITKGGGTVAYRASVEQPDAFAWKPSIFMPRWASRITLEIAEVRVQRLQEISGRDVLAEGVDNGKSNPAQGVRWENMQRMAFESLWDSINGKRAPWSSNPWVWAITFRRLP